MKGVLLEGVGDRGVQLYGGRWLVSYGGLGTRLGGGWLHADRGENPC